MTESSSTQLVVIGAGPGGYAAAFKAADLGLQVTIIDLEENLGGVCLLRGCIPSKALLHAAKIVNDAKEAQSLGIVFPKPEINLDQLRDWKNNILQKMSGGLKELCKLRKINSIRARASFLDSKTLMLQTDQGEQSQLQFDFAILATGSRSIVPPPYDLESARILTSTGALKVSDIPKKLLVVGGGYIGLELGSVYASLGSSVSLVEMTKGLLPQVDQDLVRPLSKKIEKLFSKLWFETRVSQVKEALAGIEATFVDANQKQFTEEFDNILVCVGRKPNSSGLGLKNTKVELNEKGFVKVSAERRTTVDHIFAIGDLAGEPMLAHKATHEGVVAAEVIAGQSSTFEPQAIPAVVFTDPEIAWCGLTEAEAKKENKNVKISRFPWSISGRASTLGRNEGVTKIIADADSDRVLGVGIVGVGAGDLISEGVLAIEMGATSADLKLTIHPHPTLSETLMEAAEGTEGTSLHLYRPKKT